MTELLHWREPLWLLLSLLPLALWFWKSSPRLQSQAFKNYADAHLLPQLIHQNKPSRLYFSLFALAWLFACIAIAGPFTVHDDDQAKQRSAIDIVLVVDISPSMTANDISPSRLQRGQWELAHLIRQRPNDRFALIAFSSNAYITLPLTYDKESIEYFLSALDTELPQRKGSNLGRALELAQQTLASSQANSRAIIVVTDGDAHNSNNLGLAHQLGQQKIPLLIWGMGTSDGAPVKNAQGSFIYQDNKPVISKLQRLELGALATASDGIYTDFSHDDRDLTILQSRLDKIPALNRYLTDSRYTQQLFPWFLFTSLLLLSFLTFKRAPLLLLLVLIPYLVPTQPAMADDKATSALQALQQGNYSLAEQLYAQAQPSYQVHLGQGSVAYRQQQWPLAISFFKTALTSATNDQERASAAYNLGNSYAQNNQLERARQTYTEALRFQSNYPRASYNLSLVTNELTVRLQQSQGDSRQKLGEKEAANGNEATDTAQAQTSPDTTQTAAANPQQTALNGEIEKHNSKAPPGVNLNNLREDARTLLEKRFAKQDRIDLLNRIEDKPW